MVFLLGVFAATLSGLQDSKATRSGCCKGDDDDDDGDAGTGNIGFGWFDTSRSYVEDSWCPLDLGDHYVIQILVDLDFSNFGGKIFDAQMLIVCCCGNFRDVAPGGWCQSPAGESAKIDWADGCCYFVLKRNPPYKSICMIYYEVTRRHWKITTCKYNISSRIHVM